MKKRTVDKDDNNYGSHFKWTKGAAFEDKRLKTRIKPTISTAANKIKRNIKRTNLQPQWMQGFATFRMNSTEIK